MFRTAKSSTSKEGESNSTDKDLNNKTPGAPAQNRAQNGRMRVQKPPGSASKSRSGRFITTPGKNQRRMARMGLSLIVALIGISGGLLALHRSNLNVTVYSAGKAIPAGAAIQMSDLRTETVPSPGIANALPITQIVNQTAAESILPGEVLTKGLTAVNPPPVSDVVIGVALAQGRMPLSGLTPGTRVEIIDTSQQSVRQPGGTAASSSVLGTAVVSGVAPGTNGAGMLVDLVLPAAEAPQVAIAAAATNISLAREN